MLNVKQGSCKYQLLKSFGLTWPRNRTQVYWLQGKRTRSRAGHNACNNALPAQSHEKLISCWQAE